MQHHFCQVKRVTLDHFTNIIVMFSDASKPQCDQIVYQLEPEVVQLNEINVRKNKLNCKYLSIQYQQDHTGFGTELRIPSL